MATRTKTGNATGTRERTKKPRKSKKPTPAGLGPLRLDSIYPLEVFKTLTGLGDSALRTARRDFGLRVFYTGGRAYVSTNDFLAYLERVDESPNSEA
jgi:hypothetical protein